MNYRTAKILVTFGGPATALLIALFIGIIATQCQTTNTLSLRTGILTTRTALVGIPLSKEEKPIAQWDTLGSWVATDREVDLGSQLWLFSGQQSGEPSRHWHLHHELQVFANLISGQQYPVDYLHERFQVMWESYESEDPEFLQTNFTAFYSEGSGKE